MLLVTPPSRLSMMTYYWAPSLTIAPVRHWLHQEHKVKRILIHRGSAVNIMHKFTVTGLGITMGELSNRWIVIQGFSLENQSAIGMICVELIVGDLSTSLISYVIDLKTSHKLLPRCPWLHEHGIGALTLHQCPKCYHGWKRKINGEVTPFTKAKSHFANAKFLEEGLAPEEMMISTTSSAGKDDSKSYQGCVGGHRAWWCEITTMGQRGR